MSYRLPFLGNAASGWVDGGAGRIGLLKGMPRKGDARSPQGVKQAARLDVTERRGPGTMREVGGA